MKRRPAPKKIDRKIFSKTANRSKAINGAVTYRGGIRL